MINVTFESTRVPVRPSLLIPMARLTLVDSAIAQTRIRYLLAGHPQAPRAAASRHCRPPPHWPHGSLGRPNASSAKSRSGKGRQRYRDPARTPSADQSLLLGGDLCYHLWAHKSQVDSKTRLQTATKGGGAATLCHFHFRHLDGVFPAHAYTRH